MCVQSYTATKSKDHGSSIKLSSKTQAIFVFITVADAGIGHIETTIPVIGSVVPSLYVACKKKKKHGKTHMVPCGKISLCPIRLQNGATMSLIRIAMLHCALYTS